jgi:hypothetical protein
MAVVTSVGNEESTCFCSDKWLDCKTIAEDVPSLLNDVPKRAIKTRTVQVLAEYLLIWDQVDAICSCLHVYFIIVA